MDKIKEPLKIRPFEQKDVDSVARIVLEAFKSKFSSFNKLSDDQMIELLMASGFVEEQSFDGYLVAEQDEEVVGAMSLKWQGQVKKISKVSLVKLSRRYGLVNMLRLMIRVAILEGTSSAGECYIEHVAVSPKYRGKGIGTMLIQYADEMVNERSHLEGLSLYVSEENVSAIKLYEKLGFAIKKREKSLISQFVLKEKSWLYMVKIIKD